MSPDSNHNKSSKELKKKDINQTTKQASNKKEKDKIKNEDEEIPPELKELIKEYYIFNIQTFMKFFMYYSINI